MGSGCGIVFKLVPNPNGGWAEQVLHRQFTEAGNPYGAVVVDARGVIYGMASGDGTGGAGGVFEIIP